MFNRLSASIWTIRHPRIRTRSFFHTLTDTISSDLYESALTYTERLHPTTLSALQEKRLMDLVAYAKRSIPFYARYLGDMKNMDDFRMIKPVSKELMRLAFANQSVVNRELFDFRIPQYTSGSTGIPFHFFLDAHMLPRRIAIYRRMLRWAGKTPQDSVIRLIWREHPGLETEGEIFACTGPENLEQKRDALYAKLTGKTIILQSLSSLLIRLAQIVERDQKHFSFRSLIAYGEPLYPEIRAYLERVFQAPIFNYYANQEVTAIAQECETHNGLHVNSEWLFLEIIDNQGNAVPIGEEKNGAIAVTSFENHVMPFIKYQTGDRGYWLKDSCPCGRTLPRIMIEGREMNSFLLPDGRMGYFFELVKPITSLVSRIRQYQVIRRSPREVLVCIVPTASFLREDNAFLSNAFSSYLGRDVALTLQIQNHIEQIPGQKHRAFVNQYQD